MAMNQTTAVTKSVVTTQVFTFFIEDMMFGLNVEHVLMLGQDTASIQKVPVDERGLKGITKYQGIVVPVLDFAHRVGVKSGIDSKSATIEQLKAFEQEHISWFEQLENAIKTNTAFNLPTQSRTCAFSQWREQFNTRDETLAELLTLFDDSHSAFHELADEVLTMRESGQTEEAMAILRQHRSSSLQRMKTLFSRAIDHLKGAMRPVLLFVTDDGKTPRFALLIDEINDVVTYAEDEFQASDAGSLSQLSEIAKVLDGIYTRQDKPDCLYFDIDKLVDEPKMLVSAEAI
ncbi:hypothetical protein LCGC14_0633520 [marine sediment metagenome]|uniref:Chemoreceptor zinc-binding domain-containing protein n=1 Tax=marine sediment metagenome TaxID=412755 RepID=A0A0F9TMT4_9ZZZZ